MDPENNERKPGGDEGNDNNVQCKGGIIIYGKRCIC